AGQKDRKERRLQDRRRERRHVARVPEERPAADDPGEPRHELIDHRVDARDERAGDLETNEREDATDGLGPIEVRYDPERERAAREDREDDDRDHFARPQPDGNDADAE